MHCSEFLDEVLSVLPHYCSFFFFVIPVANSTAADSVLIRLLPVTGIHLLSVVHISVIFRFFFVPSSQ